MKKIFVLILLSVPMFTWAGNDTKTKVENYPLEKSLMPSQKTLQVLHASSGTWNAFTAQRSDVEIKFNEESQFLGKSSVKDFSDISLFTYGISKNGSISSKFLLYGSEEGEIYAYVIETSGGLADISPIRQDTPLTPVTMGIYATIMALNKVDSLEDDVVRDLSLSSGMLCAALKSTGKEEDGFSIADIHVRGWKRGNNITIEFVPTEAWKTYKSNRFVKKVTNKTADSNSK